MMRTLLTLLATLALMLAPSALAQENESADDVEEGEQAWVDDCPPDMMCAMEQPSEEEPAKEELGNETSDEPTYSGDCGGEMCAYAGGPEDAPAQPESAKTVPAPALALGLVALGAAAVLCLAVRRS